MKKHLILLFIFILSTYQPLFAQESFAKKFFRKMYLDKDSTKKSNFVVVPALASSPETGFEFGGASLFSFYTDTVRRSITRVSNLYGYASLTTKGQEKVSLNASYWEPQNTWHYTANISFYNFPFDFYGVGNNTKKANEELVDEKRTRIVITAQKLISQYFYAGLNMGGFKYYYYSGTPNQNQEFKNDPNIQDESGGSNLIAGPILTFDNRNNNTYTTKGFMLNANLNGIQGIYSNSSYTGGFLNIDYSQFFLLQKKLVLGLNAKEQSLLGGRSPFYLLPQLGNDALMRGYYTGRYRDRNLLAGQAELRYRLSERFGVVGFLGTGEVANNAFSASQLKPNYGGGLRYFFDIEKGLSIRADYGFGEKPAGESREQGFYIALGEAF
ncbi:BamA/TamA family outer membrane protein [Mucilaginibacter sp.]